MGYSPVVSTKTSLKMSTMEPVAMEEAVVEETEAPTPPPPPVFDPKGAAGVTAPFGFFDPLSLCPDTEREFIKYREAELKHGRVAMLAFAGFFVEKWVDSCSEMRLLAQLFSSINKRSHFS